MRIGILGGSFDPIHQGHLALARESEKKFHLDKVLFIPAPHPPHKSQGKILPIASPEDRARMVELAIRPHPQWELSDIELKRPGISYTVDTLRGLRELYPLPHELFFIVGADSFIDLKDWKDPEEIMKLSEWIVAPRPGVKLPAELPARFHLLPMAPVDISASQLRKKIEEKNQNEISDWVPQEVQDYIQQQKVYSKRPAK